MTAQALLNIQENVDLRKYNTFHVSAVARYFADVTTAAQLREALTWVNARQVPYMLIGQGSNLLFKQDYPGLIIELNIKGIRLLAETHEFADVEAQCGEVWHNFVQHALRQGWYGIENLSLIPGTVGAAPVQNIGAYGVEVKDTLLSLEALHIASGELRTFTNADCGFGYRDSIFKRELKDQFVICSVVFRLHKQPRVNITYPALQAALRDIPSTLITPELVSAKVCEIRSGKLPDHHKLGNAGSFFWNPLVSHVEFAKLRAIFPGIVGYPDGDRVKVPAAWLIEKAGWKGYRDGDVGVHREHALVLVNYGTATGAQLVRLSEKIQESVQSVFGIRLQPEVRII
jgi:UDP-N-acetylmuramate dehydrogenase